jgi:hypothetical protein
MTISPLLRQVAPRAALIWLVTREVDTLLTLLGPSGFMSWYFWDGGFYWGIAKQGYLPGDPRLAAYFPLYPVLIRSGMLLAPELVAALLVSSLAFLAALVAVGLLGEGAWAPMLLLAASPLAFFFTGMYADGLFLALVAGALLASARERWALCGILLGLACVTRPFGLALVAALVIASLLERRGWRVIASLTIPPAVTLAGYGAVLAHQYGDPLAFAHVERSAFGHSVLWPWQTIALQAQEVTSSPHLRAHMLLDLIPPLVCLAALLIMWRRWPQAWTLSVAGVLLLLLVTPVTDATGQYALISAGRYTYAAVPVLLACATWLERLPRPAAAGLLAASFALQVGLTVFVLRGGWIV